MSSVYIKILFIQSPLEMLLKSLPEMCSMIALQFFDTKQKFLHNEDKMKSSKTLNMLTLGC